MFGNGCRYKIKWLYVRCVCRGMCFMEHIQFVNWYSMIIARSLDCVKSINIRTVCKAMVNVSEGLAQVKWTDLYNNRIHWILFTAEIRRKCERASGSVTGSKDSVTEFQREFHTPTSKGTRDNGASEKKTGEKEKQIESHIAKSTRVAYQKQGKSP